MNMLCILDIPADAKVAPVVCVREERTLPRAANRPMARDPNGRATSFEDMDPERAQMILDVLREEIAKL